MTAPVSPIPKGFRTVTPHLVVAGADKALDFYQRAFGADIVMVNKLDNGTVIHAQIAIGDSVVMLAEQFPDWGSLGPNPERNSPVIVHLFVPDVDAFFQQAIDAGATAQMPVQDTFWGDRYGSLVDPFGHRWSIASRVEDLTPDEIAERSKQAFPG